MHSYSQPAQVISVDMHNFTHLYTSVCTHFTITSAPTLTLAIISTRIQGNMSLYIHYVACFFLNFICKNCFSASPTLTLAPISTIIMANISLYIHSVACFFLNFICKNCFSASPTLTLAPISTIIMANISLSILSVACLYVKTDSFLTLPSR